MAAPTVYRSSDASAPTLNGTTGSLLTVLDAILVNGYGSQPAAGWSKPLANSGNKGCYQGSGVNQQLWVDDSGPGTGGAREARLRGCEGITAVATPTASTLFPQNPNLDAVNGNTTVTLVSFRKSATLDSTARTWICLADGQTFMLFSKTGDYPGVWMGHVYFGDVYSFQAGDAYKALICGRTAEVATGPALANNSGGLETNTVQDWSNNNTAYAGHYFGRNGAGTQASYIGYRYGIGYFLNRNPFNPPNGLNQYDQKIYINRFLMSEPSQTIGFRGYLRGIYQMPFAVPDQDTFDGSGDFAGRSFIALNSMIGLAGVTGACLALETTAWDTST